MSSIVRVAPRRSAHKGYRLLNGDAADRCAEAQQDYNRHRDVVRARTAASVLACLGVAIVAACSDAPRAPTSPSPHAGPLPDIPIARTATLIAVGDIGECGSPGIARTARLAESIDGEILLAGDLAYSQGSMQDFIRCFEPFYGSLRRRWRPAPGNHEYDTAGAAGYFQYFGAAAGRGYYAFGAGEWLVLMLNSNIPVGIGSPQYEFVRSQLLAHRNPCAMAVWHHPLFSSGPNGPNRFMRAIWELLYENDADVVVAAHDHLYERFGKQDVEGRSDFRGLRQFIVGTGGAQLYDFQRLTPNSQARVKAFGVLRLTLHLGNYEWEFIDANGGVADAGSDGCH